MNDKALIQALFQGLCDSPEACFEISRWQGGDIHRSYRVKSNRPLQGHFTLFVKVNLLDNRAVIESEYTSLRMLATDLELDYPQPISFESDEYNSYLIMAYHDLIGISERSIADTAPGQLGIMLAQQHRHSAETFGWDHDNHIGLSLQQNRRCNDWLQFYREQRLKPQLCLAADNGLDSALTEQIAELSESLTFYFAGYKPVPALLHGDLWAGNAGYDLQAGKPLLFDPAPYYGDREADIAMTELFGGFPPAFYHAYQEAWPLADGYRDRKPLYNLYHALRSL